MVQPLRRIVVGMGRIEEPDAHLRHALQLAEALGARAYVVHAYHLPDPLLYPYPEMATFDPAVLEAAQQSVQRRLEDQVSRLAGGATVECRTVPAPADASLIDTAEEVDADLIVVGATERGAVSRVILGTTAGRVLRASPRPVMVIRDPEAAPIRRVLMTTDLSELSGRVYRRALGMVEALAVGEVELRTLLVVGDDLATPPPARMSVLKGIAESELRPFLQRVAPAASGTDGKVRLGDAAGEIAAEAKEWSADLVVVGSHGRGGISRFLIGSVAEAVVRHSPCDVLVIPAAAVTDATEAEANG